MEANRYFNVSDFINQHKLSGYQLVVIILCGLVTALDGFDTQSIAFVAPVIAQQWGLQTSDFGIVFSAGLLGVMLGSVVFGMIADRFGRKVVIMACLAIMGIFSLVTISSESVQDLIVFRFLTGIGLGGAIPNTLALTAEYSPKRLINTTVTIMFCGFPLGAVIGGLVMSRIIPVLGWEIVFIVGGLLPLAMIAIVYILLPESIRFLVTKHKSADKIIKILTEIKPAMQIDDQVKFTLDEQKVEKANVRHLFERGMARTTLLLWIMYFMCLLVFYCLVNWLPTILKMTGVPIDKAILSTAIFNLGGICGGIAVARLIDKRNQSEKDIIAISFLLASCTITAIGFILGITTSLVMLAVFLSGFFVMGSTMGVQALMTRYYPTAIRSTGVGWTLGVGRIGAIIGPMAAGVVITLQYDLTIFFMLCALPALAAAVSMLFLKRPNQDIVESNLLH
jgi:MFS transporter, AAHS family, 4-hydroxybenzoate transporter